MIRAHTLQPDRGVEGRAAVAMGRYVAPWADRSHHGRASRTFQPVQLKVLPALLSVMVRSHMPGRLAKGTCWLPSKHMCS